MSELVCVLVVDDDENHLRLMKLLLGSEGFDVHTVASGQACIDFVTEQLPDIVLLDMNLPDLQGPAVITKLREITDWNGRIIGVSGQDAEKKCIKLGANGFIMKPIHPDTIAQKLRDQLATN